jgi:hypothetical protein
VVSVGARTASGIPTGASSSAGRRKNAVWRIDRDGAVVAAIDQEGEDRAAHARR